MYIFLSQIYFGVAQYKLEKKISLKLNFLCYKVPYYAKSLETICSNITMVEVQTRTPLKKVQCDNKPLNQIHGVLWEFVFFL